jgi:hypothetical protein
MACFCLEFGILPQILVVRSSLIQIEGEGDRSAPAPDDYN